MSASAPAPLPRAGEVFFDVRGSSRSMRLSWYADTGVAVLSIWQGGVCTGTFRLAMADVPRLVAELQRGPAGQHCPQVGTPGLHQQAGDRYQQQQVTGPALPAAAGQYGDWTGAVDVSSAQEPAARWAAADGFPPAQHGRQPYQPRAGSGGGPPAGSGQHRHARHAGPVADSSWPREDARPDEDWRDRGRESVGY